MDPPADSDQVKSQSLADWLISELVRWQTYHNHKEQLAWTATAFYLTAFGWFAFVAQPFAQYSTGERVIVTGFIVTVCVASAVFVNFQFRMRHIATIRMDTMGQALGRVTVGYTFEIDDLMPGPLYPSFIHDLEGRNTTRPREWRHLRRWEWGMASEAASYVLIAAATVAVIATIWAGAIATIWAG